MSTGSQTAADPRLAERLVGALASARSAEAAIDAVLREVAVTHGCALALLWSLDEVTGALRLRHDWASGTEVEELRRVVRRLTFPPGVGLPGRVLEAGEPMGVSDVAGAEDFPRAEVVLRAGLRCASAAPLASNEGPLGVIEFFAAAPGVTPEKLADVGAAARQLAPYLARLQIEDRLRVTEEESASIVQAALDCIVTMDHRGEVLDFNPAAEATFGYERAEAVGRQLADLIIPPELREAHQRALVAYVQRGRPTILGQRLELVGMRADGSTLPVELTVTRLGTREPPVFAGFIRDISERRALEAEQSRLLRDALMARAQAEAAGVRTEDARADAERALLDAEHARARLAFLAKAGRQMAESMDWEATLRTVVRAAVPVVADGATLTVAEAGGRTRLAAVAHVDPERERQAWQQTPRDERPARVLRTGELELDEGGRVLVAPLRTPAGVIGALTLTRDDTVRAFGEDDVQLVSSFAARASLHVQNARLYTERSHIARTLQASLRPQALPEVEGAEIGARFLAAGDQNEVGGDFYDLYPTGDRVWGAIVGDVSGKGAEAAAVTALARHTLRTASMLHEDPAAILTLLNRAMIAQGVNSFCTVVYARVCPVAGGGIDVRFANGGHPAPLVLRAGGQVESQDAGRGPLVGALTDAVFAEGTVRLAPGDLVVLYTDGVTEVRTSDPALGDRELRRVLGAGRGGTAAAVAEAIERRAVELQNGRPRDDIAILAIRAR